MRPGLRLGMRKYGGSSSMFGGIRNIDKLAFSDQALGNFPTCHYPIGEPRDLKFCGETTIRGSSYCDKHHKLCHVKDDNK